ncbi:hypothetical protein [Fodinibius saliphilus]|uniref:hypothetical protein n=1 Tax=Fodinibius saliphilus TaxID=1920650 RepID=UPI001107DB72|nr:hypothetical protein [Fodinibius saliphilus]
MSNIGKRFTKPSVWEKPYFTRLNLKQRLFWLYLNNRCDLAGVFQLHFPVDSAYLGFKISEEFVTNFVDVLNKDSTRLKKLNDQRLWLKNFVRFQQAGKGGTLSSKSPPHKSIVRKLKEHGIFTEAVEDDPELYSNYTDDLPRENITTSESNLKGSLRVSQGFAKGYSNGKDISKGSSNGNNIGLPDDLINKAENILSVFPNVDKNSASFSIITEIGDVFSILEEEGVNEPEKYLLDEIKKIDEEELKPPDLFFEEIKRSKEIPF